MVFSGFFEYGSIDGKMTHLKVHFNDNDGLCLLETPISKDQVVDDQGDGDMLVKATVKNTWQLRWWLLGFGHHVTVLEPEDLRENFMDVIWEMFDNYNLFSKIN